MANFSFLAEKSEFKYFAKDCIAAEEAFQIRPTSCIDLIRTALTKSVQWLYDNDSQFVKMKNPQTNEKNSLFALTTTPTFKNAVGQKLSNKVQFIRTQGNDANHPNGNSFSGDDALKCLRYLFDFVQWIDEHYGKNFKSRSFDPEEVPVKDSTLKKVLKGAGLVAGGAVLGVGALLMLAGGNEKK